MNHHPLKVGVSDPVTAATITDVQIKQLQDEAVELLGKYPECTVIALAKPSGRDRRAQYKQDRDAKRYEDARGVCAALWNQQHA